MKITMFKFLFAVLFLSTVSLVTSCSDDSSEDEILSIENYVDGEMNHLHRLHAIGKHGCYELVYPISVTFPDGSTVEAANAEALRSAIKAWKEAETRPDGRPMFVFPIQVIDENGDIIDVASAEDFKDLRKSCRRDRIADHKPCFKPVFPITFEFEDGSTFTAESAAALRIFIKEKREDNRGRDKHIKASIVFPITVEYEDGTQVSVDSKEALKALKEACAS